MEFDKNTSIVVLVFSTLVVSCSFAPVSVTVDELQLLQTIPLSSVVGPESLAFDPTGQGPYTGVSDGRILKWDEQNNRWTQFAVPPNWRPKECDGSRDSMKEIVCGRPLGLQFHNKSGKLYIADAYFGLLEVGPEGGVARSVAAEADGVPFFLTDGVDIDQENGIVYFTDGSARFHRKDHRMVVITGDVTGRLLSYDPQTKNVTVLFKGMAFPNGVAISEDNSFLLVAETAACRISRYWLKGPKAGNMEIVADLPGYPDNIKRSSNGQFWVALNAEKLPNRGGAGRFFGWPSGRALAVKLNKEGRMIQMLRGKMVGSISEVEERDGTLWLGSVELPYVGIAQI